MNKVILFLLIGLMVYTQDSNAKESFFKRLEKGVEMTSKEVATAKSLDDLIQPDSEQDKARVVYKNKTITKEVIKPSAETIVLKKKLANSQHKLAWEKAKDNKHKAALALYKEALEYDANNWRIWHGYGWSFSELKHYNEARNAFLMAIRLGAKDASWHYLGWNYDRQGYYDEATRCYAEAIAINVHNKQALYALNQSIKRLNQQDTDHEWYQVTAKPYLTLHLEPNLKSKKIGEIPYKSLVKLIKYTGTEQTISNSTAHWALIEYKDKKAYVFGAYLKKD